MVGLSVEHGCIGENGSVGFPYTFPTPTMAGWCTPRFPRRDQYVRTPQVFDRIACQVRDPLLVVNSGMDMPFDFTGGDAATHTCESFNVTEDEFRAMPRPYMLLAWWHAYTQRALVISNHSAFRFPKDDYSVLFGYLGVQCDATCMKRVRAKTSRPLNRHAKKKRGYTWNGLLGNARSPLQARVVDRAHMLASALSIN